MELRDFKLIKSPTVAFPLLGKGAAVRERAASATNGFTQNIFDTVGDFIFWISLRKRILGENHPDYARSLNNLAGLYDSQGRYDEAKSLYQQALEICDRTLGTNHPNTVTVRKNLEDLRWEMNGE